MSLAQQPILDVHEAVHSVYSAIAQSGLTRQNEIGDNLLRSKTIAMAFGYPSLDLDSLPEGANLGLSCGNPVGGETVVDLGCGGGFDVSLACPKVGLSGQVIGLDMSDDMLSLARRNAERAGFRHPQVQFQKTVLPHLPLDNATANLIISNCVLNLLPTGDKAIVWREIASVLCPGGRVAISDILAHAELPSEVQCDMTSWTGCILGAIQLGTLREYMTAAGLSGG